MRYVNYNVDTINKVGYSVIDNQVNFKNGKLSIALRDSTGNIISAYLARAEYKKIKLPSGPIKLPKDWAIVHCIPELGDTKEEHFILTIQNSERAKRDTLPIIIGDEIHLKSMEGVYKVVYVTRDLLIITCKPWSTSYISGTKDSPIKIIFWDDYKCKRGEPDIKQ